MPRGIWIKAIALGILAEPGPLAPAAAQSAPGSMGARSQAEVRISVRVMPRFKVQADSAAHRPGKAGSPAVTLTGNTPSLRFALVTQPGTEAPASATGRLLVLVVPD